ARVWWHESGEVDGTLKIHSQEVHCLAWSSSPSDPVLVTGSYDQTIRFSGKENGKWTSDAPIGPLGNAIFSLTSHFGGRKSGQPIRFLATRGDGSKATEYAPLLLELEAGKPLKKRVVTLPVRNNNWISVGCIAPDGELAATTGGDNHEIYL